ncbi:hypothetical protein Tco_0352779 [Tanacetum coccineum]
MAPLPPREQRHPFLRYQGLEYTGVDIADFEERLERIYSREIHRRQFILALGLYVGEEMESLGFAWYWSECGRMIPGKGDLHDYWRDISTDGDFLGPPPFYTLNKDPVLRLCHRMIAHSIAGRSQAPEKVTMTDLFYLRGLDVGSVNIPYLLARYLMRFAARRKSGAHISGGQFVARLPEHFGLLTAEILRGLTVIDLELPIIDMGELVRLQICMEVDDTWAWVAMGPERQPDATAGSPEVAQDASIIDEGGQADPTPIRGALTEQREVIDAMAHDFSRFSTWAITGLARMMDKAGVAYVPYSETHVPYQRRNGYHIKDKNKAKNRPNQARDGKDKVKSKPKSVKVRKSKVNQVKKIQLEGLKLPNLKLYYKYKKTRAEIGNWGSIT